jgi:hypothetical protein
VAQRLETPPRLGRRRRRTRPTAHAEPFERTDSLGRAEGVDVEEVEGTA